MLKIEMSKKVYNEAIKLSVELLREMGEIDEITDMFIGLDEVEEQIKEMGFINIDLGYLKAVMTDDKFIIEFSEDILIQLVLTSFSSVY
jgi:hypothetical protein